TTPIQSKMVSKAVESSQKRVEGNNFDSRKQLLQYDDVLRQQREVIYKQRFEVIDSDNLKSIVILSLITHLRAHETLYMISYA
ncbi:hypothetical protein ACQ4LK_25965, partial [Bacillus pumilus]